MRARPTLHGGAGGDTAAMRRYPLGPLLDTPAAFLHEAAGPITFSGVLISFPRNPEFFPEFWVDEDVKWRQIGSGWKPRRQSRSLVSEVRHGGFCCAAARKVLLEEALPQQLD